MIFKSTQSTNLEVFQHVFNKAPIALVVVNKDGRIQLFNEVAQKLFKYTLEEVQNAPVEMLISHSLKSKHMTYVKEFFINPAPRAMGEGRNLFGIDKEGTEIPIEVGLNPIQTESGGLVMASIIDITKRLKIESRFQKAIEAAPIAIVMINRKREIIMINLEAKKLFGYQDSEIIGKEIEILIPTEVRPHHPTLVEEFFKDPQPRQMGQGRRLYGLSKDGRRIPIEVGLSPIHLDDGVYIVTSIIDMTRQIRDEKKFKDAVEAAPNAMLTVDAQGSITMANQQCVDLFQYSKEELLGKSVDILVPQQFKSVHPMHVKKYLTNPEPRAMGTGRELFGLKKDGTLFPVEVGLRPIVSDSGISIISSIVDISERVKDKKEILERNQELQEFSYRASHDLKAPLVSIAGLSEMAIEDCKNKNFDLAVKNMDQINSLSRRLKTFVDDILSLTKSEHLQSEHGVFSFQKCLENIQNKLEVFKTEASVKIVPAWNHQRELSIQPVRLNQILENLISNAMKYADIKKPEKIVNITTYNDESFFYITVSDNGIGIPKAYFDRVFQMFSRFHNDTIPGSGLGLYLVKKHVDKLKGTISFESSSLGTSFFIKLPLT